MPHVGTPPSRTACTEQRPKSGSGTGPASWRSETSGAAAAVVTHVETQWPIGVTGRRLGSQPAR